MEIPDWIEWNGKGDCPLSEGQRFDAKFEDGHIYESAGAWEWDFIMYEGDGDPIPVAYRLAAPLDMGADNGNS